jgi:hypothetical protein
MSGTSPFCSTSLGKMSSATLLPRSFWSRFTARSRKSGSAMPEISSSAPRERYQSSSVRNSLNSAIDSR